MNGAPNPWTTGPATPDGDAALRDDLARLVPAPAVDELAPGRLRLIREQFMTQIEAAPPVRPATAVRRTVRRRLAVAVAVAVALVATVVVHPWSTGDGLPYVTAAPDVAALLDHASGVAGAQPAVAVRADQFVYIRSSETYAAFNAGPGGETVVAPVHEREIWLSADGRRPGLLREYGADTVLDPNPDPGVANPTYEFLAALPTNPVTLLDRIYRDTAGQGTSRDTEAFVTIGDLLLESLCPPAQSAALFRAAERIPGVTVVHGATDHLGRPALAVGRVDPSDGIRTQWLFDPSTYALLGESSVATRDIGSPTTVHAGDVVGVDAVEARGVVDRAGTVPHQGA